LSVHNAVQTRPSHTHLTSKTPQIVSRQEVDVFAGLTEKMRIICRKIRRHKNYDETPKMTLCSPELDKNSTKK